MYAMTNTHSRAVVLRFLHTEVVSMTNVFVGASAFKYAKKLAAWNITKVSTGCGTTRNQSCMKQMLGEYNNLDVWATLNSCDRKTLWNAWYDIVGGARGWKRERGGSVVWIVGRVYACACVALYTPSHLELRLIKHFYSRPVDGCH